MVFSITTNFLAGRINPFVLKYKSVKECREGDTQIVPINFIDLMSVEVYHSMWQILTIHELTSASPST